MFIQSLTFTNFKNYEQEKFDFTPGFNFLVGNNGMGKTNVLDGIYYVAMTKSHFQSRDHHIVRNGSRFFRIQATLEKEKGAHTVTVKVRPGQTKEILMDGVVYQKMSEHIGHVPVVLIAPKDVDLITGPSAGRRKFADRMISQTDPEYVHALVRYHRFLNQRNAMLKEAQLTGRLDMHLLSTYNMRMQQPAAYIYKARRSTLENLLPNLKSEYQALSSSGEVPSLAYASRLAEYPFDVLCDRALERDTQLGRTTSGIHQDDIRFFLDDFEVRKFASQGQLKSFLIALNLAKYALIMSKIGDTPILLLDDIFDKLDEIRAKKLLQHLRGGHIQQVLITDASQSRVDSMIEKLQLPARVIHIAHGRILHAEDKYPVSNEKNTEL